MISKISILHWFMLFGFHAHNQFNVITDRNRDLVNFISFAETYDLF